MNNKINCKNIENPFKMLGTHFCSGNDVRDSTEYEIFDIDAKN